MKAYMQGRVEADQTTARPGLPVPKPQLVGFSPSPTTCLRPLHLLPSLIQPYKSSFFINRTLFTFKKTFFHHLNSPANRFSVQHSPNSSTSSPLPALFHLLKYHIHVTNTLFKVFKLYSRHFTTLLLIADPFTSPDPTSTYPFHSISPSKESY